MTITSNGNRLETRPGVLLLLLKLRSMPGGLFVVGTVLMAIATRAVIPVLVDLGVKPILAWFLSAGLVVFIPLVVLGWKSLSVEAGHNTVGKRPLIDRLRLRKPTAEILWLSALGFVAVVLSSGLVVLGLESAGIELTPSYLSGEKFGDDRCWILAAWVPFFVLNILGEEFVWRGVVLPLQEQRWGRHTWLVHAAGWALFHLSIGLGVMLSAIPIFVVISYLASRTQSIWPGIVIHGGVNGPAFVAVVFGLVG